MRSIVALGFIVGVGCGGMEGDGAFAHEAVGVAEQAASTTYRYRCTCIPASGPRGHCFSGWERMNITVSSTRATTSLAPGARFTYDAHPSASANAAYARYTGAAAGGSAAVLVEKKLRTGGYTLRSGDKGGYAKYTVRSSDGFDSLKFICRR